MSLGTIQWTGASTKSYAYDIHDLAASHKAVPANYVFARKLPDGTYTSVYAGQTGNISGRFDSHNKWPCIVRNGATHVCTHESSADERVRRAEEDDIIAKWKPPCNIQGT